MEVEPYPGADPERSQGPGAEPREGPALERLRSVEGGGTSTLEAVRGRSPARGQSLSRASKHQLGAWQRMQPQGKTELRRGAQKGRGLGCRV